MASDVALHLPSRSRSAADVSDRFPCSATYGSLSVSTPTFERYVTEGWAYLKYNNGRFFFDTELDWFNRVYRFQRSLDGTFFGEADTLTAAEALFASKYWESWRYMAEAGARFGPLAGRVFFLSTIRSFFVLRPFLLIDWLMLSWRDPFFFLFLFFCFFPSSFPPLFCLFPPFSYFSLFFLHDFPCVR